MYKLMIFAFAVFLFFAGCSTEEPSIFEVEENGELLKSSNFPERVLLPVGFEPEGIETGRGTTFYVGSLATGEIFRGDYKTGEGEVFIAASERLALGLSYDSRSNYLFVAGGATGSLFVYDGTTGELIEEFYISGAVIINDVIVTKDAVYMTESVGSVIYKLPLGSGGALTLTVEEITLTGEYDFVENAPTPYGINNNGIAATPNGKYLIIGNMADGNLYKVNGETGYSELIDLGGASVPFNDGLILHGNTLYVVQNIISQISVIDLSPDLLSGAIKNTITSSLLEVPATAALFGNFLYAVNARFTLPPGPFYVVKISR